MRKCFFWFLLLCVQIGFAQQNLNWKGYFSYNQIKDISESNTALFAAAENALFVKNLTTNSIKTINTVDGLSGQTISAMYHSVAFNKTIVGYDDGLMIVVNDADGSMLNVVDIINKNIPTNIKKINHFMEYNGVLYVSCDFGIVQYKLATLEFGDTYFIGPNGAEIKVYQTTIFNNDIYAVTQNNGIRKAAINNPNLIDFAQWQVFDNGFWNGITTFNNQLIGLNLDTGIYKYNGSFFQQIGVVGEIGVDIRSNADQLIVTSKNHVFIFNQALSQIAHIQPFQASPETLTFTCATTINGNIYIGTNEKGILTSTLSNPFAFEFIMPNGPVRNNLFSINTTSSNLWAVYGDYTEIYDPNPFLYLGISKYANNQWTNIPYSEVHLSGSASPDLVRVTVNPNNEKQIFVSSYYAGLLKFEDDQLVTVYNKSNSGLETIFPTDAQDSNIRIEQSVYDRAGNLWMTNGLVKNALKVLKTNNQWQSYDMTTILDNYFNARFGRMVIDKSGTKWICTSKDGVVAFNENGNIFKKITMGETSGNLPIEDVRAIAIDNRNQLWIGTRQGLRVLPSVNSFTSDEQMKANAIIILEDGLPQELLYEQFITDIVVNGSNQKWIGTADSGVFLFSSDGQQTLYHFTKDNSPLPSNVINDIDINATTGEVFFATDKGMVSFQGTATRPADDLSGAYVYPNPVRPGFTGTVKIAGLISKANIKITDIEGNLVYETTSEGGTVEWDTTAFGKYKVASGVYMIFIAGEDGTETKVKKVMIIR
ncbi:T9SS type A sorting domain-containing protein [Flavobacterium silvisoli]|uniref:T9SS type A sorting domain-containing protein n=1 Tax=Flavobacterium silvisoli TaxID=2529433 RepID=A0A4V2L5Q2_9FLAO|nr:T9SS type A sorting domain-containing protein [Flavobacterium silvisoli]TBX71061.1 T9SS type A sorting domain-containing protein [Flavobacterium silvisoli]